MGSRGRKEPSRCAPSGTSSASPAWATCRRHGWASRRCSATPITWACTARSSGPRRSTSATSPRRSHTWRSSAPRSISTGGSRLPATPGDHYLAAELGLPATPVTTFMAEPFLRQTARYVDLNCRLSLLSALIFDSSVAGGTFNRAAAPNCFQKLLPQKALQQVRLGSSLERAHGLDVAAVGRQHDDSCVRKLTPNGDQRFDPIDLRHLHVHERDIRSHRSEQLNGLAPVRCLGHGLHIGLRRHQGRDPFAQEWMVVDGEDSNRIGLCTHGSPLDHFGPQYSANGGLSTHFRVRSHSWTRSYSALPVWYLGSAGITVSTILP